MGAELAATFAAHLAPDDIVILTDPVYFGGTVDRSLGADTIVARITGPTARHIPARDDAATAIAGLARPGDRIVVMGARDDTLSAFAKNLLGRV